MRILSWSVGLALALVIVLFAISNRQWVDLGLWPLEGKLALPLFVPVLVCAFLGLLVGAFIAWLSAGHWRRLARQGSHRTRELELRIRTLEERRIAAEAAPRISPPALRQISGGRL